MEFKIISPEFKSITDDLNGIKVNSRKTRKIWVENMVVALIFAFLFTYFEVHYYYLKINLIRI